jgi:triacylglycerol lipase
MDPMIDADLDTLAFSVHTGHFLAYASNYAYEENGDWFGKLGLNPHSRLFTCGQFHGFVGFLNHVTVVAFRGTQSVGNCLTDAETPLVARAEYPGRVHLGFSDAVSTVWPDVQRLLGAPAHATPLWVTGHSLGGAMATLASVRLADEGYTVRAVYTYGSPRVGDRTFRDKYTLANYRFVNDDDLVPHMPFRPCYKHVGDLKLLDRQGHLAEEQAVWKQKKRQMKHKARQVQRHHSRRKTAPAAFSAFDWLADHLLVHYLEAILRLLPHVPHHRRNVGAAIRRIDPGVRTNTPPAIVPPGHVISPEQLVQAFFQQPGMHD